jgi:hypothetical protein
VPGCSVPLPSRLLTAVGLLSVEVKGPPDERPDTEGRCCFSKIPLFDGSRVGLEDVLPMAG